MNPDFLAGCEIQANLVIRLPSYVLREGLKKGID